jgi:PAS domain S-box-containing protein
MSLAANYWLLPPLNDFGISAPLDRIGMVIFLCIGLSMCLFAEIYRRNRDKAAAYDREVALRDTKSRLAMFVEATFEGIVESNAGWIVDCNEQFARMLGYSRAELLGMQLTDCIAPVDRERVQDNVRQASASVIEYRMVRKDGTHIIVEEHGRPGLLEGGIHFTAIRDITKRKQAEDIVSMQARMLNAVGQAVIATDPQHVILFWNTTAATMFGWSTEEVLGQKIQDILQPDSDPKMLAEIMATLTRGQTWSGEFVVQCRDTRRIPLATTNAPLLDEQGQLLAIIGIGTDISRRKEDEAIIQQQIRELTQLNNVAVGRELRMIELKQEINALCASAGQPPRYPLDFLQEGEPRNGQ